MFEDKTLVCKDCGNEFIFTAGEQEFYAEKGFQNEPLRCKDCRIARKNSLRGERVMHTIICADCGADQRTTNLFIAANVSQNIKNSNL